MVVTSRDVARLAGVSQPTVSRALRDDIRVSEQTKQRVREAAQLLGYVPSEAGRALSSGRTRRIGLLLTDLDNQFYSHIIAPVHRELERLGYQLMLHTETADNDTIVERLLANGLDGVILATTTVDSAAPLRLRDRGLPFVYFNRTGSLVDADATVVDAAPGYREAVRAAVDAGASERRRRARPEQHEHGADTASMALRAALGEHGIALDRAPGAAGALRLRGRGGRGSTSCWQSGGEPAPTLLFCGNDVVAYGALNAAHRLGPPGARGPVRSSASTTCRRPPGRSSTSRPSDTTSPAMASASADLVVRRIEHPDAELERAVFASSFLRSPHPRSRALSSAPFSAPRL